MAGLSGIVKRDNAFHDVFRYFGFTVENVVNIVKCRMCHILPNVPKVKVKCRMCHILPNVPKVKVKCRICHILPNVPKVKVKCRICHILPNMPKLFHNSIVTVDFFKIKSVYICVRESDCNRVC